MSKYQINYGRKLPEHRLPFDYLFQSKIKSPFEYFKYYKQGFNNSWLKHWSIYISFGALAIFATSMIIKFWDEKQVTIDKSRTYFPALFYKAQISRRNKTRYHNVLKKFQNDQTELKDQSFNFDE